MSNMKIYSILLYCNNYCFFRSLRSRKSLSSSCALYTLVELCSTLAFPWHTLDNSHKSYTNASKQVSIIQIICKVYANEMRDELLTFPCVNIVNVRQFFNFFGWLFKTIILVHLFSPTFIPNERSIKDQFIDTKIITKSCIIWCL